MLSSAYLTWSPLCMRCAVADMGKRMLRNEVRSGDIDFGNNGRERSRRGASRLTIEGLDRGYDSSPQLTWPQDGRPKKWLAYGQEFRLVCRKLHGWGR